MRKILCMQCMKMYEEPREAPAKESQCPDCGWSPYAQRPIFGVEKVEDKVK